MGWQYAPQPAQKEKSSSLFGYSRISPNKRAVAAAARATAPPGAVPSIGTRRRLGSGVPTDPYLSQAQATIDAEQAAQIAKINAVRSQAQAAAQRDVDALKGLGVAATGIMSGIPGQIA